MIRNTTFLSAFFTFISFSAFAGDYVNTARDLYIEKHKDEAVREMIKSGVPASITLAQACLESNDGRSTLAMEANNHFGIKCADWKGPSVKQDDDKRNECFRKYNSTLESYDDHSNFLRTRQRYAFLFDLDKTDYKGWAKGLKKAGYATDPAYAERLIKIIEDNQLYMLDEGKTLPVYASNDEMPEELKVKSNKQKKVFVSSTSPVNAFNERNILSNNGVDYILAKKGDSFQSLSKELGMGYWQLPKYNEMDKYAELKEGQVIYIKPKKKESPVNFVIAKEGDDIHSIAHQNGVKKKFILKYNKLQERATLAEAQKILLSKPSKS
jgi:LysM repeat protein